MTAFDRQIGDLLKELAPRQRGVIRRRYGIGGGKPETLESIGKREGITRERVRQIENDALSRLKKSPLFAALRPQEEYAVNVLEKHGGMMVETAFLALPEFDSVKDKRALLFFLDLSPQLAERRADDHFHARWYTKGTDAVAVGKGLGALAAELGRLETTVGEKELLQKFEAHLAHAGVTHSKPATLGSYLALSKEIEKNTWGEYGHVGSPFVRPRGMRESAYVALSRAGKPLHFRQIAEHIGEFADRAVHVQTVHNELIKDDRFVLVGRGLYALRSWGYEPGFVKDVLVNLLANRGALSRDEILKEVARRRQVKPSTVFINLQNKKLFKAQGDGTYTLVS